MGRTFNGTSDVITLNLGATNFVMGPGTVAVICKTGSSVSTQKEVFSTGTNAGSTRYGLGHTSAGVLFLQVSGNAPAGTTVLSTSTWYCLVGSKDTGTVAPRFSIYNFSTKAAWVHENAGTTAGNATAPTGNAYIGTGPGGAIDFWPGSILLVATWNSVLTDAQRQTLAVSYGNWLKLTPSSLNRLPDAPGTSVTDDTNNGATQSAVSGTTTATDAPSGFNMNQIGFNRNTLRPAVFKPGLAR